MLAALFLWAYRDTLTVRIEAQGGKMVAIVNGYPLIAEDDRYATGGAALWLRDQSSFRNYVALSTSDGAWRRLLARLWQWDLGSNPQAKWEEVGVAGQTMPMEALQAKAPLLSVNASWLPVASLGDPSWRDYTLEARLLRPRQDAGVLVRSTAPGTGYLFWFRPEHGDTGWELWQDGQPVESLATGGFRLPLASTFKAVAREILWSYVHGLALLLPVAGLALAGAWASRRRQRTAQAEEASAALGPSQRGMGKPWALVAVVALLLAALGTTSAIAVFLYDRIPHVQDSVTYLFQAQTFARGQISAPAPPLPEFFRQEFLLVKDGQWFGKYPPGHPLVLALGVLAGVPWLVGPVVGTLALGAAYLVGSAMYGRGTGLLAVALGLLSPFFLFLAASFMAHATELLFLSLFLLGFVKAHEGKRPLWALATGLFWGLAFITRTLGAVGFALPFGLYALWGLGREPKEGLRRYGGMALGALAPIIFLLWYNYSLTGSPLSNPFTVYWDFDRVGFGPGVGGAFGGHTPEAGLMNTWRNVSVLLVHLYGWLPYFSLAFAILPFVLLRADRWDALLAGAALGTIGAYFLYWADGIMFGPRYYYSALPAFLLLTARGIQALAAMLSSLGASRPWRLAQRGVVSAMVAFLVAGNLLVYLPSQVFIYNDYNSMSGEPLDRVREAKLTNALVFVEDDPDWQWWRYGALFTGNTPWLDGEVVYARDLGPEENRRLMEAYPERKAHLFDGRQVREVR